MSPLLPEPRIEEAPAPAPGPLAHFAHDGNAVDLGLASCGSVRVTREGITILAPDEDASARTWARLGRWARGQYLAAQGYGVLSGAALSHDGQAVLLVGGARSGASVLALVLARQGWPLISDGLIVIDGEGNACALEPEVTVDAEVASALPPEVQRRRPESGRERLIVTTDAAPDSPIGAYVLMRVHLGLRDLSLEPVAPEVSLESALSSCALQPLLPPESAFGRPPLAPTWRLARPATPPTSPEDPWAPRQMGLAVREAIAGSVTR